MKIVIAIDSLKGSLSSIEAANAIKKGIENAKLDAKVIIKPLADGGEGTVDALVDGMNGRRKVVEVCGPSTKKVKATYGILDDSNTAIMEMAQSAGITQVKGKEKNPLTTTTYGVGEMIKEAINEGCRYFIMGIGGSATNDAGATVLDTLPHGSFFHATGGAVNMKINERLKLIPYEAAIGLTITIVSTIIWGLIY